MKPSFFIAAKHGEKHILKDAIHAENVNIKDSEKGYTLLCYAAAYNNKDVVDLLLKQGANINIQGGELNQTPLMLAAERNNNEIVNDLLAHPNIDVTLIDAQGRNALMLAVLSKNIPAINALITKTNLRHIDNFADTVFHLSEDPTVNDLLVPHLPHQP